MPVPVQLTYLGRNPNHPIILLPIQPFINPSIHQGIHPTVSIRLVNHLPLMSLLLLPLTIKPPINPPIYPSLQIPSMNSYLSIHSSNNLPVQPSTFTSIMIHLSSIHPSIDPSTHLSSRPSIHTSLICAFIKLPTFYLPYLSIFPS